MHTSPKPLKRTALFMAILSLLMSPGISAQESSSSAKSQKTCTTESANEVAGPGCAPESCRGAKTKFAEAKVITDLRMNLLALKEAMTSNSELQFPQRALETSSYKGKTDEETLKILLKEVELLEWALIPKTNASLEPFNPPDSKAAQVAYLNKRIALLKAGL